MYLRMYLRISLRILCQVLFVLKSKCDVLVLINAPDFCPAV